MLSQRPTFWIPTILILTKSIPASGQARNRRHIFEIGRSPVAPVVLLLGYAALMCAGLYLSRGVDAVGPPCAFRSLTGVPCPACGSTRMVVLAASGEFGQAFLQNPLMFVLLAVGLPLLLARRWTASDRPAVLPSLGRFVWAALFVLGLIANWVYVIITEGTFSYAG